MHWLAFVTLAACAVPDAPMLDVAAREDVGPDREAAAESAPQVPREMYSFDRADVPAATPIVALPAAAPVSLAATEDGRVVATVDANGAMRLWPALDGSLEPVVVSARRAVKVVIARDGGELVLGALDALGQLELVRLTATGVAIERTAVATPRPIVELRATSRGFIARRDDQVLAWLDLRGELHGEVTPAIGERIVELATRHDRVLAIVEADGARRGRWLAFDSDQLAWGAATPQLAIGDGVALAPGGTQVLAHRSRRSEVAIFDLRTGRSTTIDGAQVAVGFLDDNTAFYEENGSIGEWYRPGFPYLLDADVFGSADTVAVTDRSYIAATNAMLQITADMTTQYLGYRMSEVTDMVPVRRGGWLATDTMSIVHLDAHFHADREYEPEPRALDQPIPLWNIVDDRHVVSTMAQRHALYDLDDLTRPPVELWHDGRNFDFERSTGIAALSGQLSTELVRYDPIDHSFGESIRTLTHSPGNWRTTLVDPAVARGLVAVDFEIETNSPFNSPDRIKVVELRASKTGTIEAAAPRYVTSDERSNAFDVSALKIARARRASPDHALVAELDADRLTVRAATGGVRWSRAVPGAIGLYWSTNAQLVVYGQGIASVDASSGELLERRCGWRFGLWNSVVTALNTPGLCDAP